MTIASKLLTVAQNDQVIATEVENIRQAIIAKNVPVAEGTPISQLPSKVAAIQSGGGSSVLQNAVKATFIDYDGRIIKEEWGEYGFTPTLPPNPEGDDIRVFSAWAGDKENLTRDSVIGALYWFVDDLSSYIFITLDSSTGLTINFRCTISGGSATVDWGDGTSSTTTGTGYITLNHVYGSYGDYRIRIRNLHLNLSNFLGGTGSTTQTAIDVVSAVTKVYIGYPSVLEKYSFKGMTRLRSVCFSNIGTGQNVKHKLVGFTDCVALTAAVVPSSYYFGTSSNVSFSQCYGLKYFVMPLGGLLYYQAPNSIFQSCSSLEYVRLPSGSAFTEIPYSGFQDCRSLKSFYISDNINTISFQSFYGCYALSEITIPESVTTLSGMVFMYCYSLKKIDCKASATSIGTNFIDYCWNLKTLIMRRVTPPSINATSGIVARSRIHTDFRIYVPDESVDIYKATSGWSLYADIIYPISALPQ